VTSARAIATRCRWPPELSPGRCLARPASPRVECLGARLSRSPPRQLRVDERQLDVLQRRRARQQRERLEDEADLPVADVRELAVAHVGKPARRSASNGPHPACRGTRRCSSASDLPDPEGPMIAVYSPRRISTLTTAQRLDGLASPCDSAGSVLRCESVSSPVLEAYAAIRHRTSQEVPVVGSVDLRRFASNPTDPTTGTASPLQASSIPSSLSLRVKVLRPQPSNFAASWRPPWWPSGPRDHGALEFRHRVLEQRGAAGGEARLGPACERLGPISETGPPAPTPPRSAGMSLRVIRGRRPAP